MAKKNRPVIPMLIGAGCAAAGAVLYAVAPGEYFDGTDKPFRNRYFAHRGLHSGSAEVPENTMPAFLAAIQNGYGIELDVQLTAAFRSTPSKPVFHSVIWIS